MCTYIQQQLVASTTDTVKCCCNRETEQYRDFNITWNITLVNKTVVTECKGNGVKGRYDTNYTNFSNYFIGNVTRTCGLSNEWLPSKVYCIREKIETVLAEVGLATFV